MTAEHPDRQAGEPVDQDQAANSADEPASEVGADTTLPGWPVLPPEGVALLAAHLRRTRRP